MEVIRVKKGELIARQRQRVKEWYILQEGVVMIKYDFVESKLGPNSIIGILEQDWFLCDYVAATDVTLFVFPCNGFSDLKQALAAEPKMRRIFLRTAMLQRHQLLGIYVDLYNKVRQFQHFIDGALNDYSLICAKNKVDGSISYEMEKLKPLEITHKAEIWEMNNSNSLIKSYLDEYLNVLEKDENLCVGAIMEASAQMHRVVRGVGEMVSYLNYNKDILIGTKKNNLFHALFDLELTLKGNGKKPKDVQKLVAGLFTLAENLNIYGQELLATCREEYATSAAVKAMPEVTDDSDDLSYILDYAGYEGKEKAEIYQTIMAYQDVAEADARDEKAYQLRRKINVVFYEIYEKAFFKAMETPDNVPAVLEMFFDFGYMGEAFLGEDKSNDLYELSTHMNLCQSDNVFTIYRWLKAVYQGQKEPSKNEFDMDYNAYLIELYKQGEIKKEEIETKKSDIHAKVQFEISNMFKSVNRLTYGNITMFCPILREADLFNTVDKMLVTAEKVQQALDDIRKIDYSVFYRELTNHGLGKEMMHEALNVEILPDVILMPNAGNRAMMWQETASVRNDTPARYMLPIFTSADLGEMVLEITGRYRWEMCRKVQGVHWNDIRDRSLTSEYYDYLQFYRKNRELSSDTKEQIKGALVRAKNNFREVFVRDYQNWIKYEAKGGFRLNKYVRAIIFNYCPFSKEIRDDLKSNPMFAAMISKHEINAKQVVKRLDGVYGKYKQSGGEVTAEMKENYHFYQM